MSDDFETVDINELRTRLREAEANQCLICECPADHDQELCSRRLGGAEARVAELEQDREAALQVTRGQRMEITELERRLREAEKVTTKHRETIREQAEFLEQKQARVAELGQALSRVADERRVYDAEVVKPLVQENERLRAMNDTLVAEADTDLGDLANRINADLARREHEARAEVERLREIADAARQLIDGSDWAGRDTERLRQALGIHAE